VAMVERKILYGNMVKIFTPDFDASIVTCKKEGWFHSIETTFGWVWLRGGPLHPCGTRCVVVLSV
jgi:hypothetical protein